METSTSGRVLSLRGGDLLAPAVCLICRKPGSEVDEKFADPSELFADPQIHEDFFGSVYFCESCSLEIAAVFGAKSNREIVQLEADCLMYKTLSEEQADVIKEQHDVIYGLRRLDSRTSGIAIVDTVFLSSTDTQAEPDSQQGLSEPTEQRADEGAVVTESSNGEGPNDTDESERDDVNDFLRNL